MTRRDELRTRFVLVAVKDLIVERIAKAQELDFDIDVAEASTNQLRRYVKGLQSAFDVAWDALHPEKVEDPLVRKAHPLDKVKRDG